MTGRCGGDPFGTDAEDVGCVAGAIEEGLTDGTAGFTAGIRGRCAADEMGVFPRWVIRERGGKSDVRETNEME